MPFREDVDKISDESQPKTPIGNTLVVDAEAAVKKLTTKYGVPPKSKKLFGPLNIKALYEIVNDPAMLQIDALVQRGELSHEEAYEYILALPEYDAIRVKIIALAKNLVAALKRSGMIRAAVKKSAPSKMAARPGRGFKPGKELHELSREIDNLTFSQVVKGVNSFRNGWLLRLKAMSLEFLALEVIMEMNKDEYTDYDRNLLDKAFFLAVDEFGRVNGDNSFSVVAMKDFMEHFEWLSNKNGAVFAEMIKTHEEAVFKDKPCTDKELAEENNLLFEEIKNQSSSKKIKSAVKCYGDACLEIPVDMGEAMHQDILTIVTLHFNGGRDYKKTRCIIEQRGCGAVNMRFDMSPESFEFIIDRSTGNLCYTATLIPVKYSMDSRQYALLRNLVYTFLIENLEGRLEPVAQGVDGTRSELAECLDGQDGDILADRIGFARKYPSVHPSAEDTRTEEEIWDEEWKICRYRARGKNGRIILAAIKRILKREPIRIMGSHQVFEGDNGKRCPIPIHPSDTMALGSLKNFLITLDISPLALADEL